MMTALLCRRVRAARKHRIQGVGTGPLEFVLFFTNLLRQGDVVLTAFCPRAILYRISQGLYTPTLLPIVGFTRAQAHSRKESLLQTWRQARSFRSRGRWWTSNSNPANFPLSLMPFASR